MKTALRIVERGIEQSRQHAWRGGSARGPGDCHYPPETSKWKKVEHQLLSFISMNWRGRPLLSVEAAVNLIGLIG
jgi:hypothetical protein